MLDILYTILHSYLTCNCATLYHERQWWGSSRLQVLPVGAFLFFQGAWCIERASLLNLLAPIHSVNGVLVQHSNTHTTQTEGEHCTGSWPVLRTSGFVVLPSPGSITHHSLSASWGGSHWLWQTDESEQTEKYACWQSHTGCVCFMQFLHIFFESSIWKHCTWLESHLEWYLYLFAICLICIALVEELLKTPVVRVAGASWSSWETWSSCSQSCTKGYRTRRRTCTGPEGKTAPVACRGTPVEYQDCNVQACPGERGLICTHTGYSISISWEFMADFWKQVFKFWIFFFNISALNVHFIIVSCFLVFYYVKLIMFCLKLDEQWFLQTPLNFSHWN